MAKKNGYKQAANIKEIKDDAVYLRDSTVLAVLEVAPIDFDRMNEAGKQRVLKKYKQWIESLDYPVQITARNVNMDIEGQAKILKNKAEHLIKQKAEYRDLLALFKEFEEWFDSYIKTNSKTRRIYYLIIPYMDVETPSMLEKFRKSKVKVKHEANIEKLNRRAEECVKKLEDTGVKTHRLSTEQLGNLYWSYFMINNQKGANDKSTYIGPEDWFGMWENAMAERKQAKRKK